MGALLNPCSLSVVGSSLRVVSLLWGAVPKSYFSVAEMAAQFHRVTVLQLHFCDWQWAWEWRQSLSAHQALVEKLAQKMALRRAFAHWKHCILCTLACPSPCSPPLPECPQWGSGYLSYTSLHLSIQVLIHIELQLKFLYLVSWVGFYCCDKLYDQQQSGEERVCFIWQLIVHHEEKLG